jgi:hypothetical protein
VPDPCAAGAHVAMMKAEESTPSLSSRRCTIRVLAGLSDSPCSAKMAVIAARACSAALSSRARLFLVPDHRPGSDNDAAGFA